MVLQAQELIARGKSQALACKAIGVSVMTFHRWRKLELVRRSEAAQPESSFLVQEPFDKRLEARDANRARIDELRIENGRLRRIVTDLLLEKTKIEEKLAIEVSNDSVRRGSVKT